MIAAERVSVVVTVTGTVKGVGANAPILASINYSLKLNRKEVNRDENRYSGHGNYPDIIYSAYCV